MPKPKVTTNPVANAYSGDRERIVEYSIRHPAKSTIGGLIAFRELPDGNLLVNLYRHDPEVDIRVSPTEGASGDSMPDAKARILDIIRRALERPHGRINGEWREDLLDFEEIQQIVEGL